MMYAGSKLSLVKEADLTKVFEIRNDLMMATSEAENSHIFLVFLLSRL